MIEAGYSSAEAQEIKAEVSHYETVRQEVKLASGDYVDMKMYEPAMRHLLDTYIRAEDSEKLSSLDDLTLVEMIVQRGAAAVDELPDGIRNNGKVVAETIENNVRRLIIDESAVNPKYYEKMSELLDALIQQRRQEALGYQEYLDRIVELTRAACNPATGSSYPGNIDSNPLRALFELNNAKIGLFVHTGADRDTREMHGHVPDRGDRGQPRRCIRELRRTILGRHLHALHVHPPRPIACNCR